MHSKQSRSPASLVSVRDRLRAFAEARDWDKFHSPKNLCMALIAEAAELVEHFQWLSEEESAHLPPALRDEVEEEVADVLLYLVRLADKLGIDPIDAANRKIDRNEAKYPAAKVRGSARKYSDYE